MFFGVLIRNSVSSCQSMTEFSEIVCASLFVKNFWYSFRNSVRMVNFGFIVSFDVTMPRAFRFLRWRQRVFFGIFAGVLPGLVMV